jgi:FkbM family methyltransferase
MVAVTLPDGLSFESLDANECRMLYNEIFTKGCYVPPSGELPQGGVVVDVGANIGMFALFAGRRWHPSLHLAIEPVPPLVELLRANVSAADLSGVTVLRAAAGACRGVGRITYFPDMPSNSTSHPETKQAELDPLGPRSRKRAEARMRRRIEYPVAVRTLDELLPEHAGPRIDLLKIDVEGDELGVLRGIGPDTWSRLDRVVVEVSHHPAGQVEEVVKLLAQHGLQVTVLDAVPGRTITATVWGLRES